MQFPKRSNNYIRKYYAYAIKKPHIFMTNNYYEWIGSSNTDFNNQCYKFCKMRNKIIRLKKVMK